MWMIVQEDRLWSLVRKAVERIVLHFGALELTFNFYDDAPRAQ